MEKIDTRTPDLTVENIEKLIELFPQVATEVENKDGQVEKAVDFDALRDLLGDVAEGQRERYQFTWPGKREAKAEARRPINKTMIPCPEKSVDWDATENLYIEGDNLDALKLLKETYAGKIKFIYIDPPYNTGNDFIYDDDFALSSEDYESGELSDEGRLVSNPESNGRFHSDWCSMMYPRLLLARDLLRVDGVIFISIDENEANNLERICNEIFGVKNFLTRFIWRKVDSPNDNHVVITPDHEYVLAYCRNVNAARLVQKRAPELVDAYNGPDENGRYWRDRLLRKNGKNSLRSDRPTMFYPLLAPDGTEVLPIREDGREGCWAAGQNTVEEIDAKGDLIWKKRDELWVPYTREYASDNPTKPWMTIWNDLPAMRQTKAGMKELFGSSNVFDTPKPPALIERCMEIAGVEADDIVLDFFSGSASTAHAVVDYNVKNSSKAKFILVQLPHQIQDGAEAKELGLNDLCELGEERIRRVGSKTIQKVEAQNLQLPLGEGPTPLPDIGFRVLRIDTSNFKDTYLTPDQTDQASLLDAIDNVKDGRTAEDILFQSLPDFRIPYSAHIEQRDIEGKKIFDVNHGQLLACFDADVTNDIIEEIARRKPSYAVMRDLSFKNDSAAANFEELFKTFSPDTIRRVI